MMETRTVPIDELRDREGWELANGCKVVAVDEIDDGQARVVLLHPEQCTWHLWVCDGGVNLVLENGRHAVHFADDLFALDVALLAALVVQVVYQDHGASVHEEGNYPPLSDESRAAFDELLRWSPGR